MTNMSKVAFCLKIETACFCHARTIDKAEIAPILGNQGLIGSAKILVRAGHFGDEAGENFS